jgi:hypothetical protein
VGGVFEAVGECASTNVCARLGKCGSGIVDDDSDRKVAEEGERQVKQKVES